MRLFILLTMLSGTVFGAEITTLEQNKTELLLVTTDETLQSQLEKNFMVSPCRPRITINSTLKEFYFPSTSCRAEISKFIINSGYKPDQFYRTFQK